MEVTVAFGIFAILVAVLMQFLSTAQRSWNLSEKRARAYADSRILFDLMEKALNTSKARGRNSGNVFEVDNFNLNGVSCNGIAFWGVLPYRRSGTDLKSILQLNFNRVSSGTDVGDIRLSYNIGGLQNDTILQNTTNFTINMFNVGVNTPVTSGDRPDYIIVRLSMFGSDEDYAVWQSLPNTAAQNSYFTEHGFTFTRIFTLPRGE